MTLPYILSGWATRDFSGEDIETYMQKFKPSIYEISKDFVEGSVSIKKTFNLIKNLRAAGSLKVSYAGTTDFVNCSGMDFGDYLKYLAIQASQANYLGSDFFRVMVGGEANTEIDVIARLKKFSELIDGKVLIEIHGGWEGSIDNIKRILEETDFNFVIDFQNVLESGLSYAEIKELIGERVEYYHTRNMGEYVEHPDSIEEEKGWKCNEDNLLWEPKLIGKGEVIQKIK